MTNFLNGERFMEDLFEFRRDFDEIFNQMVIFKPWKREMGDFGKTWNFAPAVEAYVDKDAKKYVCRVVLPGVEPKDVHIHAQGNLLSIRGERKVTRSTKEVELREGEIVYGAFERVLTLPEGVVTEKLNAEYVNGVLELTAPVAAAALPRRIEIKTVPMTKQVAA
jgi:HSP20 family protein